MQRLFPARAEGADPLEAYAGVARTARGNRPHVVVNMVSSTDGATAAGGVTAGLSSAADKRIFAVLRSVADVVLVGAGTVRAERYGPVRLGPEARARRAAQGQSPLPTVAVVSGSLELDWSSGLFAAGAPRPVVVTAAAADATRRARAAEVADVVVAGDRRVDVAAALASLREWGASVVLCEGGPSLNGELAAAGAIDELCLTLSPSIVGGAGGKRLAGDRVLGGVVRLVLLHVLEEDGFLFLRYGVDPSSR